MTAGWKERFPVSVHPEGSHLDMQEPSLVQDAPEYDSTGAVEDPEG